MESKLYTWRKKVREHQSIVSMIIVVIIILIAFTLAAYWFGWDWTGFSGYNKVSTLHTISSPSSGTVTTTEEYQPGKALWDWLQLLGVLAIPVVVGFGVAWFSYRQNLTTSRIADDQQREDALQAYFDKTSELLLKEHLNDLARGGGFIPGYEEVRQVARARTFTVLTRLDSVRKRSILQFLYEVHLINIFDWSSADLREAALSEITFTEVNLSGANLGRADLSFADLSRANLSRVNLSRANLCFTDLSGANLSNANLREADLTGADLTKASFNKAEMSGAHLNGAKLSGADLSGADLTGVNLSKIRHWRTLTTTQRKILLDSERGKPPSDHILQVSQSWENLFDRFLDVHTITITFSNGTNLSGSNLSRAKLNGANLSDVNLEKANLTGAGLAKANLRRANLKETNLTGVKMSRVKRTVDVRPLSFPFMSGDIAVGYPKWADLEKGDRLFHLSATEAKDLLKNFEGNEARLTVVDLKGGQVKIARLEADVADLTGADLTGADLSGANLRKAIITREQLDKAKLLKGTIMPDGTKNPL